MAWGDWNGTLQSVLGRKKSRLCRRTITGSAGKIGK